MKSWAIEARELQSCRFHQTSYWMDDADKTWDNECFTEGKCHRGPSLYLHRVCLSHEKNEKLQIAFYSTLNAWTMKVSLKENVSEDRLKAI